MFRRSLTFPQMAVAMCLGSAGGVYIYAPYYRSRNAPPAQGPAPAAEQAPPPPPPPPPPAPPAEGAGPERRAEPQSKDGVE